MHTINPLDLSKNTESQNLKFYFRLCEEKKAIERGERFADETFAEKIKMINNFNASIDRVANFLKVNY